MAIGSNVTAVRLPTDDGDLVRFELDTHWVEDESEHVATVHVKRYGGDGSTPLGRIDRREKVYHMFHHDLADFVRWSDKTVTLGVEELVLANQEGCTQLSYLDEKNNTRYTVPLQAVRENGWAARRERIGWRWAVPLELWDKQVLS